MSYMSYCIVSIVSCIVSYVVLYLGEHTLDDEGSAERQIQSVFDFLEEAEDLDRGCEYWGANPRHSLNVDDEEEMGNVEPKGESSDDDVFTSCLLSFPVSILPYFALLIIYIPDS